jgi:hypothetical protein
LAQLGGLTSGSLPRFIATMDEKPLAAGPSKDPQPSVDRIDELARRILAGDILLPKFQRDFVWERQQVIALLDSVARGYPIGSILLWQSRQNSAASIGSLISKSSCRSLTIL